MSWERMILGRRGEHLGRWRWPLGVLAGALIAVFAAQTSDWLIAAGAGAFALLAVTLTVRDFR